MALIVLSEQPLGQILEHVAEVTAATVPRAGEVSVILVEGARTCTVVTVYDTGDCTSYPEFAAYASVALSSALALAQATDSVGQVREPMTSRAGIEQAKGVLMGRHGISADHALEQLAHRSRLQDRELRDVAGDVVRAAGGETGAPVPELV